MSEAERAISAAWWIVDDLVRFGMEHACVSPGSRSTPIALALARHPSVSLHVHLDERASGFFALGVSKATGRPVAVATTSGTAASELFPAVVEASMSRATLVLLTADRPPELRGVGANQAIDQVGLFGSYVRASLDAPVPGDGPDEEGWHELIVELTKASMGLPPGPIHLNLPFREPLVGADAELPAAPPSGTGHTPSADPSPEEVEALERELASTAHGLIVGGPAREAPPTLPELARAIAWPMLAEPTSWLRVPGTLSAGQFLLGDGPFANTHVPDVVVQFGAAPTSRAGLELVRRAGKLVIVDQDHLVADPHRKAAITIRAEAAAFVPELQESLRPREEGTWFRDWTEADTVARSAVDRVIDGWDEPFEGRIARDVAASMPEGSALVVGSSMPVRDLDAYMRPRDGLRVLANRGASGIDGFVSTALGVAATGVTTAALCGDLTLLHDVGS
ncbi:MAG TPA: 2-succinyl-5-enolpyruvyl-6-hydroxy-3-cyclohexene-1-carboxylic-acid synthase, partial [Actinomycetota bacterium]|nr:2-succinyl-5-enolpyruvyl-6-hydroxy-3-cyclohexene-1-carboxylic-acid synthase [Actinomycetota bacterium]